MPGLFFRGGWGGLFLILGGMVTVIARDSDLVEKKRKKERKKPKTFTLYRANLM